MNIMLLIQFYTNGDIMKMALIILAILLSSCSTQSKDNGCFKDELTRIISYDTKLVYQLSTVYVYPSKAYDVEEGKEYTWCVDENRNIISVH